MARARRTYAFLSLLTMLLGLASRRWGNGLPGWVTLYAGDALWALLVFWLIRFWHPRWQPARAAAAAAVFALLVELSQLWQTPWLDALRRTMLGALVLGQGFRWNDLLCYAVGIAAGVGLEQWTLHRKARSTGRG
jgi:Protein of unknown function (DUF2809)